MKYRRLIFISALIVVAVSSYFIYFPNPASAITCQTLDGYRGAIEKHCSGCVTYSNDWTPVCLGDQASGCYASASETCTSSKWFIFLKFYPTGGTCAYTNNAFTCNNYSKVSCTNGVASTQNYTAGCGGTTCTYTGGGWVLNPAYNSSCNATMSIAPGIAGGTYAYAGFTMPYTATWADANGLSACQIYIDGTWSSKTCSGTSFSYSSSISGYGNHTMQLYETDGNGYLNYSSIYNYALSVAPPAVVLKAGGQTGSTSISYNSSTTLTWSTDDPTAWQNTGKTLATALGRAALAVIGDYVYLFGGYNGSAYTDTIYKSLKTDLATWTTGGVLPSTVAYNTTLVVGDYIYLYGGLFGGAWSNKIYRAPVSDPTAWTDTSKTIPGVYGLERAAVIGSYVYLFGGYNGSAYTNTILKASVTDPTTFTLVSGKTLPGALGLSQIAITTDAVYLFGGYNGSAYTNVIYKAFLTDPTTWANTGKVLPSNLGYSVIVKTADALYLYGGHNGSSVLDTIYKAALTDPTTWNLIKSTFSYTGGVQTYTVPAGVTSVIIEAWGAQGYPGYLYSGGNGGYAKGTLTVTPGQVLNVYVGGQTGYNGGGNWGVGGVYGGGASDVRTSTALSSRVIVGAGGGGASNATGLTGAGGAGGGTSGSAGVGICLGAGGGQSGGGNGSNCANPGGNGSLGQGGGAPTYAGAGGGGYYGGGAGGYYPWNGSSSGSGGGGGGSSYTTGLTSANTTNGVQAGNGKITINASSVGIGTLPTVNYAAQIATIGDYIYLFGGSNASVNYNTIYKAPLTDPTNFTNTGKTLPGTLALSEAVIAGDSVYLPGGYVNGVITNTIYGALLTDPTTFSLIGKLPTTLIDSQTATIGDYVYLFGGDNNGVVTNVIYKAPIANPMMWTNTGAILPSNLSWSTLAVVGDYLYLFGGYNGSAWLNKIYRAPVSNPTAWTDTGKTITGYYSLGKVAVIGNYVYLFGGYNGSARTNTIYRATTADPTTFTLVSGKTLPGNLSQSQIAITADAVYLFGGYNGSAFTNTIYKALLTDPLTWTTSISPLPTALGYSHIADIGGYLYLFGGYNGSAYVNTIYNALVSSATSCTGTNFSTGGVVSNAVGVSTGNLFANKSYTITCTGTGGTSNSSVDVLINPHYSVCSGRACVMQDGVGVNVCSSNCASASYCGGGGGGGATGPNWHSICANNQCVVADGAGTNECSTALNCGGSYPSQYYGVCAQGSCVMVAGDPNNNACTTAGVNLCSNYGSACPMPTGYSFNINVSSDPRVNVTKNSTGNVCSDGSTRVTIEPLMGFDKIINLSIQDWGNLTGATAGFSNSSLTAAEYSTGSTLTICAPADTPSDNYNITLRGADTSIGGKIIDRTVRVLLHNLKSAGWKEI